MASSRPLAICDLGERGGGGQTSHAVGGGGGGGSFLSIKCVNYRFLQHTVLLQAKISLHMVVLEPS